MRRPLCRERTDGGPHLDWSPEINGGSLHSSRQHAARYLRRLARDAVQHGGDGTDYRNTGTGSFLEHYSQRLSAACVMHGAAEGLKAINRAAKNRIARKRRSDVGV